ncbi:MAG TPA: sulfotransferase [Baekduia sp.]|nr:sulfotransferase [Baekduia sp.]
MDETSIGTGPSAQQAGDAPERRGPIFIIGAMGTGTTLLRLMLDSHEHIAVPHETGFMRTYNAMRFVPFKWTGRRWAQRLGWSVAEFDREAAAFFEHMFQRYVEANGKQRWGEKTPLHTWHISGMKRLFPDAQFVGIVRHPGGSTASNMSRFEHAIEQATGHYDRYVRELTRQAARYPKRFVVLRYEDLVLRPEPVMRALLDWLGEPWSDRVLEHHVVQGARHHSRIEGKTRAEDAIDVSRIDKWMRTMSPEERAAVGERLARLGEFYGYSMDAAAPAPITEDDSPLITGAQIAARRKQFPDLDLKTQPPVPRAEQFLDPHQFSLAAVPHRAKTEPKRRSLGDLVRRVPSRLREDLGALRGRART